MICGAFHDRKLTDTFETRIRVLQGGLLSLLLFLLITDWMMKTTIASQKMDYNGR